MSTTLSRTMSAATAAYSVYALVRPRHLGDAMQARRPDQEFYDRVARGIGGRDLAISALGLVGPPAAVSLAMRARIAMDLTDAVFFSLRAPNGGVRAKVLAATIGWATLNAAAVTRDRRG